MTQAFFRKINNVMEAKYKLEKLHVPYIFSCFFLTPNKHWIYRAKIKINIFIGDLAFI